MHKFLPKNAKNPSGFTLVELLVVITIIGILSVVGLTVFGGVQENARNTKRKADVNAISKALEAHYKSDTGYPLIVGDWFQDGKIPIDPKRNSGYIGVPNTAGFTYEVCADLEKVGTIDDGTGKDFCIKQQQ